MEQPGDNLNNCNYIRKEKFSRFSCTKSLLRVNWRHCISKFGVIRWSRMVVMMARYYEQPSPGNHFILVKLFNPFKNASFCIHSNHSDSLWVNRRQLWSIDISASAFRHNEIWRYQQSPPLFALWKVSLAKIPYAQNRLQSNDRIISFFFLCVKQLRMELLSIIHNFLWNFISR